MTNVKRNEADWRHLVRLHEPWDFEGHVLVHRDAETGNGNDASNPLKRFLVRHVFAAQKRSRSVKRELNRLLGEFADTDWGLNFGAGGTQFNPRIINLDIRRGNNTQVVMAGRELPFHDNSFDLVISQEVLEHVDDPGHWVGEIHRVLKPDGRFYCQIPFMIGYHPGPTDFWRMTREAYPVLFPARSWTLEKVELALGHGSGFYRILVEFLAVTASALHRRLYMPVKGLSAICCAPLQLFDLLTPCSEQKHRIPGGYFCVARKRALSCEL